MAQDYIMRLLEQAAAMLAVILAKRQAGQNGAALQEIKAASLRTAGLPLDVVKRLSPEGLAEQLKMAGALQYSRSVMLAELLIQDAQIRDSEGEPQQAMASYIHAFCLLYDSIDTLNREEQAHYEGKLEELANKLDSLPPNPYTTEKLHAYRMRHGHEG